MMNEKLKLLKMKMLEGKKDKADNPQQSKASATSPSESVPPANAAEVSQPPVNQSQAVVVASEEKPQVSQPPPSQEVEPKITITPPPLPQKVEPEPVQLAQAIEKSPQPEEANPQKQQEIEEEKPVKAQSPPQEQGEIEAPKPQEPKDPQQEDALNLTHPGHNVSISMDQEPVHINEEVKEKVGELVAQAAEQLKPSDSKVVVKNKRIVLKELGRVKQAIRNLQSAVTGLERVKENLRSNPHLREKVKYYLTELKAIGHS